ncbi:hypothetical protein DFH09DRAFT_990995 [Mycena vulgaris]|nr:hypothetical protein DFH09DRAFT_990995 [Mycena vulgaris]
MAPTGILNLPTELLVRVFENPPLPTETLYSVALVCRRLHFIALPIYFSRSGMNYDSNSGSNSLVICMSPDRHDVLGALQMALFIPQIDDITCVFPHPSCTSIFPILPHLHRLRRFITRLPSVKHVTLQLDSADSVCLAAGPDASLRAWVSQLEALLNCIVEKGCLSLAMIHGAQFTWSFGLDKALPPERRFTRFLAPFHKLSCTPLSDLGTENFSRVSGQGYSRVEMTLPSASYRNSRLSSIIIQSAILIHPPGLRWTLTALRKCHVTSLTLSGGLANGIIWSTLLRLLASAAPDLTALVLLEAQYFYDFDILTFISRLPLLSDLTISTKSTARLQAWNAPPLTFRHLENLEAPPNFLQYFLQDTPYLPTIKSICISWPVIYMSVNLDLSAALISTVIRTLATHGLSPTLSVSADMTTYRDTSYARRPGGDILDCLEKIEALKIAAAPLFPVEITDTAAWIAIFRCVRRVEITFGRSSWTDATLLLEQLVRTIQRTPFLTSIVVNGRAYDLPEH